MATATLTFDLADPADELEHRYALAGRDALIALDVIAETVRGVSAKGFRDSFILYSLFISKN
jgi:hypothetical protein